MVLTINYVIILIMFLPSKYFKSHFLSMRGKYHIKCAQVVEKACDINLLRPTGHVMHQQFNIQQL